MLIFTKYNSFGKMLSCIWAIIFCPVFLFLFLLGIIINVIIFVKRRKYLINGEKDKAKSYKIAFIISLSAFILLNFMFILLVCEFNMPIALM